MVREQYFPCGVLFVLRIIILIILFISLCPFVQAYDKRDNYCFIICPIYSLFRITTFTLYDS